MLKSQQEQDIIKHIRDTLWYPFLFQGITDKRLKMLQLTHFADIINKLNYDFF